MDVITFLVMIHVAGTILGTGGATLAEVFLLSALKDGKVDPSEKRMMHANYKFLRIGLALTVVSGIALVLWHYFVLENDWVLTSDKVWFKDTLVLIILINAVLIAKRKIPMWLGASISFTSWWMATILGLWRGVPYSYVELAIGYVALVFAVAWILELIKKWYFKRP